MLLLNLVLVLASSFPLPQMAEARSAGLDGKTALIIIRWCSYETELDAVAN